MLRDCGLSHSLWKYQIQLRLVWYLHAHIFPFAMKFHRIPISSLRIKSMFRMFQSVALSLRNITTGLSRRKINTSCGYRHIKGRLERPFSSLAYTLWNIISKEMLIWSVWLTGSGIWHHLCACHYVSITTHKTCEINSGARRRN